MVFTQLRLVLAVVLQTFHTIFTGESSFEDGSYWGRLWAMLADAPKLLSSTEEANSIPLDPPTFTQIFASASSTSLATTPTDPSQSLPPSTSLGRSHITYAPVRVSSHPTNYNTYHLTVQMPAPQRVMISLILLMLLSLVTVKLLGAILALFRQRAPTPAPVPTPSQLATLQATAPQTTTIQAAVYTAAPQTAAPQTTTLPATALQTTSLQTASIQAAVQTAAPPTAAPQTTVPQNAAPQQNSVNVATQTSQTGGQAAHSSDNDRRPFDKLPSHLRKEASYEEFMSEFRKDTFISALKTQFKEMKKIQQQDRRFHSEHLKSIRKLLRSMSLKNSSNTHSPFSSRRRVIMRAPTVSTRTHDARGRANSPHPSAKTLAADWVTVDEPLASTTSAPSPLLPVAAEETPNPAPVHTGALPPPPPKMVPTIAPSTIRDASPPRRLPSPSKKAPVTAPAAAWKPGCFKPREQIADPSANLFDSLLGPAPRARLREPPVIAAPARPTWLPPPPPARPTGLPPLPAPPRPTWLPPLPASPPPAPAPVAAPAPVPAPAPAPTHVPAPAPASVPAPALTPTRDPARGPANARASDRARARARASARAPAPYPAPPRSLARALAHAQARSPSSDRARAYARAQARARAGARARARAPASTPPRLAEVVVDVTPIAEASSVAPVPAPAPTPPILEVAIEDSLMAGTSSSPSAPEPAPAPPILEVVIEDSPMAGASSAPAPEPAPAPPILEDSTMAGTSLPAPAPQVPDVDELESLLARTFLSTHAPQVPEVDGEDIAMVGTSRPAPSSQEAEVQWEDVPIPGLALPARAIQVPEVDGEDVAMAETSRPAPVPEVDGLDSPMAEAVLPTPAPAPRFPEVDDELDRLLLGTSLSAPVSAPQFPEADRQDSPMAEASLPTPTPAPVPAPAQIPTPAPAPVPAEITYRHGSSFRGGQVDMVSQFQKAAEAQLAAQATVAEQVEQARRQLRGGPPRPPGHLPLGDPNTPSNPTGVRKIAIARVPKPRVKNVPDSPRAAPPPPPAPCVPPQMPIFTHPFQASAPVPAPFRASVVTAPPQASPATPSAPPPMPIFTLPLMAPAPVPAPSQRPPATGVRKMAVPRSRSRIEDIAGYQSLPLPAPSPSAIRTHTLPLPSQQYPTPPPLPWDNSQAGPSSQGETPHNVSSPPPALDFDTQVIGKILDQAKMTQKQIGDQPELPSALIRPGCDMRGCFDPVFHDHEDEEYKNLPRTGHWVCDGCDSLHDHNCMLRGKQAWIWLCDYPDCDLRTKHDHPWDGDSDEDDDEEFEGDETGEGETWKRESVRQRNGEVEQNPDGRDWRGESDDPRYEDYYSGDKDEEEEDEEEEEDDDDDEVEGGGVSDGKGWKGKERETGELGAIEELVEVETGELGAIEQVVGPEMEEFLQQAQLRRNAA